MRHLSAWGFAAVLLLLHTAPASAQQSASTYTVSTLDGSTYVGELVENVVGSHVTLHLADGTVKRIDSYEVRQQGPTSPSPAAPTPISPPAVSSAPPLGEPRMIVGGGVHGFGIGNPILRTPYDGPDGVRVHIQGSGQLFQESSNGWQLTCSIPCRTTVDPKVSYKVGGFLVRDSRTFELPTGAPSLELVAKPASTLSLGSRIVGWTLISLSAAPVTVGALMLGGTFDGGNVSGTDSILGGTLIGAGVVLLSIGVLVLLTPPATTLETTSGERIAAHGSPRTPGLRWTGSGFLF